MEEWSCQHGRLPRSKRHPLDSTRARRFDIISFGFKCSEDEAGILRSKDEVEKLITQEVDAGLPANRIVLGGFSQGGAITLATGLTTPRQLGGLAILSSWLPIGDRIKGVCTDGFTLVTERFDTTLVACWIASNYHSHLLGTR